MMGFATEEQAAEIFAAIREKDADREARMPTTVSALCQISAAIERLKSMEWREACYCPKDGSPFAVVEFGSTGIFTAFYTGEWPKGYLICGDFVTGVDGYFWKPLDKLTDDEKIHHSSAMALEAQAHERELQAFGAYGEK